MIYRILTSLLIANAVVGLSIAIIAILLDNEEWFENGCVIFLSTFLWVFVTAGVAIIYNILSPLFI